MNKRGLTLVEMIAVVTVLALVVTIVTPIIMENIKDNRNDTYETQVKIIKEGAEAWGVDHVNQLPTNVDQYVEVTYAELVTDGYVEDKKNAKTGTSFSDASFVRITCTHASEANYTYAYDYIEA